MTTIKPYLFGFTLALAAFFNRVEAQYYEHDHYTAEIGVSYLYWGAQEDQLGFTVDNTTVFFGPQTTSSIIRTHNPSWNSGIQFDAALSHSDFHIGGRAIWTHFNTRSHAGAATDIPNVPTLVVSVVGAFDVNLNPFLVALTANSDWFLNLSEYVFRFEYLDLTLNDIPLLPYIGVRGVTLDQKQSVFYTGVPFDGINLYDISVTRHNNFYGVGPEIGFSGKYPIWRCLHLMGDISACGLIGKFQNSSILSAPSIVTTSSANLSEKLNRIRPMARGKIGLEWLASYKKCEAIAFTIEYEFQYWWNQWHSCSNITDSFISGEGRWGDLSIHGLVISASVGF